VRNVVAAADLESRHFDTCGLQTVLDGAHNQMRRVERNVPGAFPLNLHREPGFGCLDDDLVI
jgi:hypothetical protein